MRLRLLGLLLFLPLPVGLYLMIAQPVHPLGALIAGVVLLVCHGFVAAPFIEAHLLDRCIWSGREIAPGCAYKVTSSGSTRAFNSYNDVFRERASRLFTLFHKLFWPLRVAVLAPVAFFVVMELLRHVGQPVTSASTNLGVLLGGAGLVLILIAVGQRFVEPIPHNKGPVRFPLPASTVALLGVFWTLVLGVVAAVWGLYQASQIFLA